MKKIRQRARILLWSVGILLLHNPEPLRSQDATFPYSNSRRESLAPALVGGSLVLWGGWLGDSRTPLRQDALAGLTPERINPLDRVSVDQWSPRWRHRSDLGLGLLLGGAVLTLGVEGGRALNDRRGEDALTLALVTSEAFLLTAGLTTATKALVGRVRPYAYNTTLSSEERGRIVAEEGKDVFFSFFSGHAAFAFAAATLSSTMVTDLHGSSGWTRAMWGSTLGLAGLTAYARVRAGMHFPTDVLVGGVVGAAVGFLVPRLHEKEDEELARALQSPLQFSLRVPFR